MFFAVNPYSMFSAAKEKFPSVQLLDNKDYLILSYNKIHIIKPYHTVCEMVHKRQKDE